MDKNSNWKYHRIMLPSAFDKKIDKMSSEFLQVSDYLGKQIIYILKKFGSKKQMISSVFFSSLASDSGAFPTISDDVNPSKSKDQCDQKCGFFGSRDVSKITKSNGSTFTKVLRGVLIPSVGILGLVGNILSIIIFNKPEMKIWNFNGSYEMTRTSLIIISKKYFFKDKKYINSVIYGL